jgi:hypothetical protein
MGIDASNMHIPPMTATYERKAFEEELQDLRQQLDAEPSQLHSVHELVVHSFIHPKDPENPASISTGVLTGDQYLWAFMVDLGAGHGDMYYYVYDTKVIEHKEDSTWVVEHRDVVLVKAQIGVHGYTPHLKEMVEAAPKFFGGYTRFTPAMIHRACFSFLYLWLTCPAQIMLKWRGCLHTKQPDVTKDLNAIKTLLDLICDHRIKPPVPMQVKLRDKETIVRLNETMR